MNIVDVTRCMSLDAAIAMKDATPGQHKPHEARPTTMFRDAETGEPIMVIAPFPGDIGEYRRALRATSFGKAPRSTGLINEITNFGFTCRRPVLKRIGCGVSTLARDEPGLHSVYERAAAPLYEQMRQLLPDQAQSTEEAASEVGPDWKLAGTPFTSGIINRTSSLIYHFDRNNFADAWSMMVVVRRDVRGGHLHLPEYDLTVACRDAEVFYFQGSAILHGVTPISLRPGGYRYSSVYYSVRDMRHCLPPEEEYARAKKQRTEQADHLIERQRNAGLID